MKYFSIKIVGKDSDGDTLGFSFHARKETMPDAIRAAKKSAQSMFGNTHPIRFDILEYDREHTEAVKDMVNIIKKKMP